MATLGLTVTIEGLDELLRDLEPEELLQPLMEFFHEAGGIVKEKAIHRAPVETGRLRGSIFHKVGGGGSVFSVSVEVPGSVASPRGFPYPMGLNAMGGYHYRAGPFSGGATAGYWERSLEDATGEVISELDGVAGEIEARWGN